MAKNCALNMSRMPLTFPSLSYSTVPGGDSVELSTKCRYRDISEKRSLDILLAIVE